MEIKLVISAHVAEIILLAQVRRGTCNLPRAVEPFLQLLQAFPSVSKLEKLKTCQTILDSGRPKFI